MLYNFKWRNINILFVRFNSILYFSLFKLIINLLWKIKIYPGKINDDNLTWKIIFTLHNFINQGKFIKVSKRET